MEENKKALACESLVNPIYSISQTENIENQSNGFIKLFRNFKNWEWYSDANTMRVFLHCILSANYTTKKWKGQIIPAGSFITGRLKLAQELKLTEQQIRTALNHLKSTNELTIKSTSQYSIITVNNWFKFQVIDQQFNQQVTNEQPTDNQQVTTTKNIKKEKNIRNNIIGENKIFKIPTIEEIKNYCSERENNINPSQFYDYYTSIGWMVGKTKMKDWKAAVRNWENKNKTTTKKEVDGWSL